MRTMRVAAALFLLIGGIAVSQDAPWVDGTPILTELFRGLPPPVMPYSAPAQVVAPRFNVGHRRDFFAFNFNTNRQYTVPSTLRGVGDWCYVYVEDSAWNGRVTAETVDRVLRDFNDSTPADPSQGIYDLQRAAFGNPPDIDGDPRIVLLLLDIKDNFVPPRGSFVGGYFSSVNQQRGIIRDPRFGAQFQSNETEMLYVDVDPLDPKTDVGLGILAHEYQHLIHYGKDTDEDVWLNEGASDFAMWLCGYSPSAHRDAFESSPMVSMTAWPGGVGSSLPYYGAAYLWTLYLYEQYGGLPTINALIANRENGIASVEATLRSRGFTRSVQEVYADWRIALFADDLSIENGRYGFDGEEVNVSARAHPLFPINTQRRTLVGWASDPLSFEPIGEVAPLQIDVTVEDRWRDAFNVKAAFFSGNRLSEVRSVQRDALRGRFTEAFTEFGQSANRILLSVSFLPSGSDSVSTEFQYSARLGKPVIFQLAAFRNPVIPDYIEVVAVPEEPVETGNVTAILAGVGDPIQLVLVSSDGGKSFGGSVLRKATSPSETWAWELQHFDQSVGNGTVKVAR